MGLLEVTAVLITVLFLIISIIVSDFAATISTNMLDNLSIDWKRLYKNNNWPTEPMEFSKENSIDALHLCTRLDTTTYFQTLRGSSTFTWQNLTKQTGKPAMPAMNPAISLKHDQIKMCDYMEKRVTPPSRPPHLPGVPHLQVNRP